MNVPAEITSSDELLCGRYLDTVGTCRFLLNWSTGRRYSFLTLRALPRCATGLHFSFCLLTRLG